MSFELKKINAQTKKELQASGAMAAKKILEDGLLNPEEQLVLAKKIIEYFSSLIKGLESSVRADVDKNRGMVVNGATLSLGSTGLRLAYEDDDVYNELKNKLKIREELLKLVYKQGSVIADTDNGQVIPIVKIKTPSKETLIVKF